MMLFAWRFRVLQEDYEDQHIGSIVGMAMIANGPCLFLFFTSIFMVEIAIAERINAH
jgi:hypothetical protein